MSRYVAAYDIGHDGRRRRVAKLLGRYGTRLQQSVFDVWLDEGDQADLRRRVGLHLAPDDEFELFPLDTRTGRNRFRWQRPPRRFEAVRML